MNSDIPKKTLHKYNIIYDFFCQEIIASSSGEKTTEILCVNLKNFVKIREEDFCKIMLTNEAYSAIILSVKAMTKTVAADYCQRIGGWCEPIVGAVYNLSLPS